VLGHVPRPLAKLLTRLLQRSPQRTWIPIRLQRILTGIAARAIIVPAGISVESGTLGGRACDRIVPPGADRDRAILYLHGGAYVVGSPRTHRGLAAEIASAGGAAVHLLDYRMAPEHTHPAALEDSLAAYRDLLAMGMEPGSVIVCGDSAGGALAVALATRLREAGEPMPGGLAVLNGWFDMTYSGESIRDNRRRDAGLSPAWLMHGGELYRGAADPSDPELSPVNADLRGLPPTYLQVGELDLLLSDSELFAERARAAGVDVHLTRFPGMWHDFQLAAGQLREADEAIGDLEAALEDIWAGRPLALGRASTNGRPGDRGSRTPRVAVIGAGFGGVGLGIRLRQAGIEGFTIFEKGNGVGGVWRDNTYPGLTCDIPSHLYSFSFEPNPDWSRTYSPQPEILAYLERCVSKYGLAAHLRLGTEVARADFDTERGTWRLTTTGGEEEEFDVLVSSCGQLSRPALNRIPGADRFAGPIFHTARWDHAVELRGRRVAVIGTGASTVQVVPAIAEQVSRLDVYQRSAPYVLPKLDRPYRNWEKRLFRLFPPARLAVRFRQWLFFELFTTAYVRFKPLGRLGARMAERNLDDQVSDPELRGLLTPKDVLGCKRILVSSEYYATLERPNVELVADGVRELTEDGVVTEDGVERPADVVVLSTGFESHSFLAPMEVRGIDGRELTESWREGANAYLGMTVAGFPNLFVMYGPNTNLGAGSIITQLECQMSYIVSAVAEVGRRGGWLAVRPEVQERFDAEIQDRLSNSVWLTGCNNWYVDEHGRDTNNWPGYTLEYRWRTRRVHLRDYELGDGTRSAAPAQSSTFAA
jgi:cation diffusion facilitator CzcD-associated flavoprotein CzcO/acetyl esterase/lipase